MMQMNIERVINATGSLLIWLVMILAAVILVGLIVIAVNAIGQGIKEMDRKGEKKDADNNTSERRCKKRRNLLYKPGRIQHRERTAGRQTGRDCQQ